MKKVLYLLGQLDDRDVEWMIRKGKKERLAPGAAIIEEGKSIDSLYLVLDGTLGIWVKALGEQKIADVGCGEVVGEVSFVDARPPSATVKAVTHAIVLRITRDDVTAKLEQDLAFAVRFYRAIAMFLADRLRQRSHLMGFGKGHDRKEPEAEDHELDLHVLDKVHLAGARFQKVLQRLLANS